MPTLRELADERCQLVAEMRRHHETAERDGWSNEAEEAWQRAETRVAQVEREIERAQRSERLAELTSSLRRPTRGAAPAIEGRSAETFDGAPDLASRIGTAEYRDAYWRYLASGNPTECRALSTATANVPVPLDMDRRIVELMTTPTNLRGNSTVVSVDSDRKIPIESGIPTGYLVAEAGAVTLSDPTFGTQLTIDPYTFAAATLVSQQYLEDAGVAGGGEDYLLRRQAVALETVMEGYFTTGTGTSQPKGIVNWIPGGNLITMATGSTGANFGGQLLGDNIIDTAHAVAPQYRTGSFKWCLSDTFLRIARKLKVNNTAGTYEYLWKPGEAEDLRSGIPGYLYGIPYWMNQFLDTAGVSKVVAAIGDWSWAYVFDRSGTRSLVNPFSNDTNLQVKVTSWRRSDFAIVQPAAFAGLRTAAT